MYADDILLVADSSMELQAMLAVVQAYVMRWRMKFNSRKCKIMVVGKVEQVGKIGEVMEEVKNLSTWVCGLIGNYEVMST